VEQRSAGRFNRAAGGQSKIVRLPSNFVLLRKMKESHVFPTISIDRF